jgi:hypothetical protein
MCRPSGNSFRVYRLIVCLLLLASCRNERPPTPSPEQSAGLNDAENMLNGMDQNKEGPEQRPGPSNSTDGT